MIDRTETLEDMTREAKHFGPSEDVDAAGEDFGREGATAPGQDGTCRCCGDPLVRGHCFRSCGVPQHRRDQGWIHCE